MSSRRNRNRNRNGNSTSYQVRRSTEKEMTPDLAKAQVPGVGPGAQVYTAQQVAALVAAGVMPTTTGSFVPLPRTDPQVAFGPGLPLIPAAIDPVRRDTGRPEPRFNEYPVSSNLPGITDRLVPWKVLRDAAAAGGVPRRCIEIRKSDIATLDWVITVTKQAVARAEADNPSAARADVEADMRKRLGPEIVRCTEFWERPDPGQDEDWIEWITKLLEDHFVLDAIAIYPRMTYGGGLYAMEILDGSTIKPLRDYRGGKPQPPAPAYQQQLWGFPRGEYLADVDAEGNIPGAYPADTLIYKRRNTRTTTPYGHSAVEMCLEDLDTWLRRRGWIRAEYTDGAVPAAVLRNTAVNSWTPQQVLEYETALNDTWSGQTLERHRLRILPPGFELENMPDVAERYKPEYDLFLLKQLANHFSTTIAELNFTDGGGLGSSGYHEGQSDIRERSATMPLYRWLQKLITQISRRHLGMPAELEFRILGLEEEDEAAADAVADTQVKSGRLTFNEDRDRRGLPRYPFPEADMPIISTTRGVIFLEGASKLAPAGETVEPLEGPSPRDTNGDGIDDRLEQPDDSDDATGEDADGGQDDEDPGQPKGGDSPVGKAEVAAYRNWLRHRPGPNRAFTAHYLAKADAPADMAADPRVTFAPAGGGADPKSPAPAANWPGWARDKTTAAAWVPRIRAAMRKSIDTRQIAESYLAAHAHLVKDDDPDDTAFDDDPAEPDVYGQDPGSWLSEHGVDLAAALAGFLVGLWTEGYAIGDLSAAALLTGSATVDWSRWNPGDADAARLVLDEAGRNGLQLLLDQAGITIHSIAANRLDKLAAALAQALKDGDSSATLARALREILDDPRWAEMVAVTELARATSVAAMNSYRANGIAATYWATADDDRVCSAVCEPNEAEGPVPVGAAFPSGDTAPPGHPLCRCAPVPVLAAAADIDPADLAAATA